MTLLGVPLVSSIESLKNNHNHNHNRLNSLGEGKSRHKVYTTFIGIGVDFNSALIEGITKMRGANYYSVHSEKEFTKQMDELFDYMVTPLVFNLQLTLTSNEYELVKVYGSPEANEASGRIMQVNTLFPSKTVDGETKGGVVLLQLRKKGLHTKNEAAIIKLEVTYETREGQKEGETAILTFNDTGKEQYDNNGIQKAIVLSRYVNMLKNWVEYERHLQTYTKPASQLFREEGILLPNSGEGWERTSLPLKVTEFKGLFVRFKEYFVKELREIGDETLEKESKLLSELCK